MSHHVEYRLYLHACPHPVLVYRTGTTLTVDFNVVATKVEVVVELSKEVGVDYEEEYLT